MIWEEYIGRNRYCHMEDSKGLRTIALFEAAKGLLVLLAGFGLFALFHNNAQEGAENIVRHLHMNPARHMPQIFIKVASGLNNSRLMLFAGGALTYSTLRFVEAYGLWRQRRWAAWFAVISGGVYLPVEILELFHHVTWVKIVIVIINLSVVLYAAYALYESKKPERSPFK